MVPRDTTAEARAVQIAVYRDLTPADRLARAVEMSLDASAVTKAGIRARHPDYDEVAAEWAARRLRLGDDLFRRAYPDAPSLDA